MQQLSIVIPCYNEAATIRHTAQMVAVYLIKKFPQLKYELILIDDGSTDSTRGVITQLQLELPQIQPIFFEINRGRGAAIKEGIRKSVGEWVIMLDADLSYDVDHVGEILECFTQNSKTDVVVVSPYMRGGIVKGVPLMRLLLSRLANSILSGFFSDKLSTVTCVVRGYRGSKIRNLPLFEEGKELHLEILRKLALCGANMMEIPGRLIWKTTKQQPRRRNNLKIFDSAKRHFWLGILIKPTRMFKYLAVLLILVGFYECMNIFRRFLAYYTDRGAFWDDVWQGLYQTFAHSPHSVVIASVCLILGFQALSFMALLQVFKLQQDETLRHVIAILENQKGI